MEHFLYVRQSIKVRFTKLKMNCALLRLVIRNSWQFKFNVSKQMDIICASIYAYFKPSGKNRIILVPEATLTLVNMEEKMTFFVFGTSMLA